MPASTGRRSSLGQMGSQLPSMAPASLPVALPMMGQASGSRSRSGSRSGSPSRSSASGGGLQLPSLGAQSNQSGGRMSGGPVSSSGLPMLLPSNVQQGVGGLRM